MLFVDKFCLTHQELGGHTVYAPVKVDNVTSLEMFACHSQV